MENYIGKKLDGRYEILELCGIGGMANVYKAYDLLENRVVAVKILRDEYLGNEDMRRRFKNESKAMAVLNHPNVMRVYDVCFSDKMQSIVMEYIDGITLKEYIEQEGQLKWKEAVHFTVQILRALQHAHDKGIVHRDIKPQNIMLLQDGTIKITDFGIARFARSETRTLTDKAIGSVHYISPEQAAGDVIDARTDIYSVGVMLYEMLTGKVPFEADTPVSVALKQIQSRAVPPRQLNPQIPEGLQEITLHAMEKDVHKRYQSAAQMLRDIDEFKRDPSISFEYKYLGDGSRPHPHTPKTSRQQKRERKEQKRQARRERAPILAVLAGVTAGFVIVTACFIGWMFYMNNPFVTVEDTRVPDLIGQSWDDLRVSNQYPDFVIEMDGEPQYNSEYGQGVIYDQEPEEGANVKVGSTIRVRVSRGAQTVSLPDFAGWDAVQARAQLEEWGLAVDEKLLFDDNVPADSVVRTAPAAETEVSAGETVTIYVSMGKEETLKNVPPLEGISPEDAKTLLESMGFKVSVRYDDEFDGDEALEGLIIGQSPAQGSQVAEGTVIEVTVAGQRDDSTKTQLMIRLPSEINRLVEMSLTIDGVEEVTDTLNPSQAKVWRPVLTGEGVSEIEIYFDGELYQVYDMDFDTNPPEFTLLDDYSDEFTE